MENMVTTLKYKSYINIFKTIKDIRKEWRLHLKHSHVDKKELLSFLKIGINKIKKLNIKFYSIRLQNEKRKQKA